MGAEQDSGRVPVQYGSGLDNRTPTSLRGRLVRRWPAAVAAGRRLDGAYPPACSAVPSQRWMRHLGELLTPTSSESVISHAVSVATRESRNGAPCLG